MIDVDATDGIVKIPHIECQVIVVDQFNIVDLLIDILVPTGLKTNRC